jgi:hypothetical protein
LLLRYAGNTCGVLFLLWLLAVILVVYGIVQLARGEALTGILLIIVGFLVGPGGASIFATS